MIRHSEDGAAVIMATLCLLLLSALGAGLVLATSTESLISSNFRGSVEARYAARALSERALADLALLADWSHALNGTQPSSFTDGSPGGVRELAGGVTVDLTAVVNTENCGRPSGCTSGQLTAVTAARPWGPNNPQWRLYAWGPHDLLDGGATTRPPMYLVALVADDEAENDGDPLTDGTAPGNPGAGRLVLRALAFGQAGLRAGFELTLARGSEDGVNVLSIKQL